jgi:predicted MFS family arabinose efflux permease
MTGTGAAPPASPPEPSVSRPPQRLPSGPRLGLRANLAQFCLLVGINALVGGMVGQERSLLSLLATETFGLAAVSAALIYIVAFGLTKAATNFLAGTWAATAMLLGVGTAMVYPTLLAAIGDVAHPSWRATAVGIYRLWRDAGFAVGALLAGLVADLAGLVASVWVVAALTAASGLVVAIRMYETLPSAARR